MGAFQFLLTHDKLNVAKVRKKNVTCDETPAALDEDAKPIRCDWNIVGAAVEDDNREVCTT